MTVRRLDEGIDEEAAHILGQGPVHPRLRDSVLCFTAELAQQRLLTAYTALLGRANQGGASAAACGRLADGIVRRISRFADSATTRRDCLTWLISAPQDQLRRAEQEVALLARALRNIVQDQAKTA
ncbi:MULTISPECIES: hypothetical protein [Nocardiopsis]|uniref:Uncharacterized protein n=1 Tax=Nocardiopsis sinuspersici TaxID=501010 RepID=A0A1V3BW79_9ACTN|nr:MULTISPECIES: hypothetical protein [Nocardiopsis]OOC52426.1 hypothetical protein NOSIN_00075 [Nocardiopsis sinuspersici]